MTTNFKTFSEQARLLIQRGMGSSAGLDDTKLQKVIEERLHYINYYRLSAYWYPFRALIDGKSRGDMFEKGTTWEKVEAYYMFDRRLRNLLFDAIARIEVSLRTLLAYHWAVLSASDNPQDSALHYKGSFAKVPKPKNADDHPVSKMESFLRVVNDNYKRSSSECALHYKNDKGIATARMLPIWVFVEFTTVGNLSYLISKGVRTNLTKTLAAEFGFSSDGVFASAIAFLRDVRNACAHKARIWNRVWLDENGNEVFKTPHDPAWAAQWDAHQEKWSLTGGSTPLFLDAKPRTAVTLTLCHLMLKKIAPKSEWTERLMQLIRDASHLNPRIYRELGFSLPDWKKHPLWQ